MNNNDLKRLFGSILIILGIIVVLYSCIAFLSDGRTIMGLSVDRFEALAPFIVGIIFLSSGVGLLKSAN
jgi:uncharacterized membrane protein